MLKEEVYFFPIGKQNRNLIHGKKERRDVMATIALYKEKANGVGGLLQGVIKSSITFVN